MRGGEDVHHCEMHLKTLREEMMRKTTSSYYFCCYIVCTESPRKANDYYIKREIQLAPYYFWDTKSVACM